MIEAITVMTVLAILTAAMVLQSTTIGQRDVVNQADLLRRNLSHLQALALATGKPLRMVVSSTGYFVTGCFSVLLPACATVNQKLIDPASGESFSVTLPTTVTMSAADPDTTDLTPGVMDFDSAGRPTLKAVLIATNPVRTITFSSGSAPARIATVLLRPITGFAEVSY